MSAGSAARLGRGVRRPRQGLRDDIVCLYGTKSRDGAVGLDSASTNLFVATHSFQNFGD
jgi:hypothetical protein